MHTSYTWPIDKSFEVLKPGWVTKYKIFHGHTSESRDQGGSTLIRGGETHVSILLEQTSLKSKMTTD